ncbi:hypothetical protein IMSAGC005_04000 [Lachnospiraceae bacterium]|nr:hypothetical protein IMSAGC005_04000 [Lachnospiraceae bacterium]
MLKNGGFVDGCAENILLQHGKGFLVQKGAGISRFGKQRNKAVFFDGRKERGSFLFKAQQSGIRGIQLSCQKVRTEKIRCPYIEQDMHHHSA